VATFGASEIGYLDTTAQGGVPYRYRLRALTDASVASDWSAIVAFELGFLEGQILDLTAATGEGNTVELSWNLDGQAFDTLVLSRRFGEDDGFVVVADDLSGDATGYRDESLVPNAAYTYRIAGVAGNRRTVWSEEATASSGIVEATGGEAAGLVGYWPFDEGAGGEAGDYSGNGLVGTLEGATSWVSGKLGGALQFSGDSYDEVVLGTPAALNLTGAVTVMAWVKPIGTSNYGVIAGIDESGGPTNDQYVLKTTVSSSHQLSFQVSSSGTGYTATDTVNLTTRSNESADGWVHVAGVFVPGSEVALFVNGEKVASTPVSISTLQSTLSTSRPFRIGNMTSSSNYGFNGQIDELRVFAASVSSEDIIAYASGEPISPPLPRIEAGAEWTYLDDGSDQGASDWKLANFDASSWSTGAAQLGYGDGDETTVISYGPDSRNKYPTTYLRKTFEMPADRYIDEIVLNILRDDGIVVFLNGVEVARDNLPDGEITFQTYAQDAVDGSNEDTFFEYRVPPDALVVGTNVLAVELHNQRPTSSDVSFDLTMELVEGEAPLPRIEAGAEWTYLDDGSDQGASDWKLANFDASSWSTGAAQLGYGDGDETTVISYGPDSRNKYPTTYLRKTFEVVDPDAIAELELLILRDDGIVVFINGVEVARDNLPAGVITYQTYALDAVDGGNEDTFFEYIVSADALVAGTNVIAVELHNQRPTSSDVSFDLAMTAVGLDQSGPSTTQEVIEAGHTWKYLDDGSDQGAAWRAPSFDDASWASGPAKFGYGDGNETTTLDFGPDSGNKRITYYFRTAFEVPDARVVHGLHFGVQRDDGVIVYVNGTEVIRDNMPAGEIDYMTFSADIISGSGETTFYEFEVDPSVLVDGTNVLAVEIHNRDGTSSDLGFDLTLSMETLLDPNTPVFDSTAIMTGNGLANSSYSGTLADLASDADGDLLVFAKVSGPDWLVVAEDGSLGGNPGAGDIGENTFVVSVSDGDEGTTTATLTIVVEEPVEIARAPLPGSEAALVFGVIPDTQGGNLGSPPDEASAIAQRFIGHEPAFIIHVGDVTDGNSSNGDTKLAELEYLKSLLVNPLAEHGIGFYPVRGNHDSNAYRGTSSGVSAWAAAFPYLFEGPDAVIDPTDVPGGSPESPNDSNFCYVLDAGHNTFFVSVDQWNGGASENYSNWVAAKFAEIRGAHPDAHIFGYSHSGLYALASHPAMSEFVSGGSAPYIAAGKQYEIDGWFSGHNHIYDRSMAIDLADDNKPYMFDFTSGSASEKFYALSRSPAADQHVNHVVDSTTTTGRPIAYLLAEVNGPFVKVDTWMSPDSGGGTFVDWSVWDTYTYSRNGLQFTLAPGQSYNDRMIADEAPTGSGFLGTSVRVIDGVNGDNTIYRYGSNSFPQYRNITTGWWSREQWYDAGDRTIVSDVVSLHGMRETPGRNRCDPYTLVLGYADGEFSDTQETKLKVVAFLDTDTNDSDPGDWLDAVSANLSSPAAEPVLRAPLPSDAVGTWGIDSESNEVWARLDYQGDFAIALEIVDTDNDGLSDPWELANFGNLDATGEEDSDNDGLKNFEEQAAGTHPLIFDTDGDLIADGVEVAEGLDPLVADAAVRDSILAYVRSHPSAQTMFDLYPSDALGGLGTEDFIHFENGTVDLRLQIWQSADFESWTELGDPIEKSYLIEGDYQFFRWSIIPQTEEATE